MKLLKKKLKKINKFTFKSKKLLYVPLFIGSLLFLPIMPSYLSAKTTKIPKYFRKHTDKSLGSKILKFQKKHLELFDIHIKDYKKPILDYNYILDQAVYICKKKYGEKPTKQQIFKEVHIGLWAWESHERMYSYFSKQPKEKLDEQRKSLKLPKDASISEIASKRIQTWDLDLVESVAHAQSPSTDIFYYDMTEKKIDCDGYSLFLKDVFNAFGYNDVKFYVGPNHILLTDGTYFYDPNQGLLLDKEQAMKKYRINFREVSDKEFFTMQFVGFMDYYFSKILYAKKKMDLFGEEYVEAYLQTRKKYSHYSDMIYNYALKFDNLSPDVHLAYGLSKAICKEYDKAEIGIKQYYKSIKPYLYSYYLMGYISEIKGRKQNAIKFYGLTLQEYAKLDKEDKKKWKNIWFASLIHYELLTGKRTYEQEIKENEELFRISQKIDPKQFNDKWFKWRMKQSVLETFTPELELPIF